MHRKIWKAFLTYGSKTLILGVLFVTVFTPFNVEVVEAQNILDQERDAFINNQCPEVNGARDPGCLQRASSTYAQAALEADATARSGETTGDTMCNTITSCLAGIVYVFMVGLGTAMAYVGAWMFSMAVALSLHSTAYALSFLAGAWETVRDLANMFFILILVYIALTIMFRAETADTMKRLAWVIVIALLINFSFFLTRVVIDTGNILAIQIYNAIEGPPIGSADSSVLQSIASGAAANPYFGAGATTKDLTASIMDGVGIYTLLNNESFKAFQAAQNGGSVVGSITELITLSFIYIAVGIMFFMLAAAFIAAAIKFIIRIVVLWFALIFSPLAFIANTLDEGKKAFQFWRNALITHAFYPPVFLFMFYFLTLLMGELRGPNGTGTIIGHAFGSVSGLADQGLVYSVALVAVLAIYLALVLIILYFCLKASDLMGVWGASAANGAARWITGMGSNIGYGVPAWVGRRTLGLASNKMANSVQMRALEIQGKRMALPTRNFLTRTVGKVMQTPRSVLQGVGEGSFDVRNIRGGAKATTLLREKDLGLGPVNYNLGTPSSGNKGEENQRRVATALRRNNQPPQSQLTTVKPTPTPPATPPNSTGQQLVALGKIKHAIDELKYKVGEGQHTSKQSEQKRSGSSPLPHITDSMDIYTILGAKIDASHEDLKQRYYDLVKKLHPDKGGGKAAEELLKTLNSKWDDIKTPEKRTSYDAKRPRDSANTSWDSNKTKQAA